MPIVDYHCHISPKEIWDDKRFENITEVWLGGDHYKWRLMRANGVDECFITVNKNAIPNDPEKPFVTSGIRVGTPAATTRGLKEEDMKEIARIMGMVARDFEGNKTAAQEAVVALTKKYPIYE